MKKYIFILFVALVICLFPREKASEVTATPNTPVIKTGKASWYSRHSPGIRRRTANNELFDDTALTCAMWGVPFHQMVKVTNLSNGKSIVVRVNDRGPHRRFVSRGRVIDLTKEAFRKLGFLKKGLINVQVELL